MKTIFTLIALTILAGFYCFKSNSGLIILVGGGSVPSVVTNEFLSATNSGQIAVVTSASAEPFNRWEKLAPTVLIQTMADIDLIDTCSGVWFCGGDQKRLLEIFDNIQMRNKLQSVLERGGVIGGTSAGASCLSQIMVYEDGELNGFGLFEKLIIDQHFTARERLGRLMKLVNKYPKCIGVGIDESTAVSIRNSTLKVLAGNSVTIYNGSATKYYPGHEVCLK